MVEFAESKLPDEFIEIINKFDEKYKREHKGETYLFTISNLYFVGKGYYNIKD